MSLSREPPQQGLNFRSANRFVVCALDYGLSSTLLGFVTAALFAGDVIQEAASEAVSNGLGCTDCKTAGGLSTDTDKTDCDGGVVFLVANVVESHSACIRW